MAEWLIAAVLKTAEAATLPGVRIPLPPPGAGGLGPIGLWCLGERLVELYGIVAILVCPPPTVWTRRSQEL